MAQSPAINEPTIVRKERAVEMLSLSMTLNLNIPASHFMDNIAITYA
jgi:hypothetical protein